MADILKKGPLVALGHQRRLDPFYEHGGDRFEHACLGLVFIVAPVGRGYFHCHCQAVVCFAGRQSDLSPLFPASFLLDDSCKLGCTSDITSGRASGLSLGYQTREELELQVRDIYLE
jgi:hypothetical protein